MAMTPVPSQGRTTDPGLLERVRDWRDNQAWLRFVGHYEPHLRGVCRQYGLVGDAAEECCQQVWMKLAAQMRTFRYDPGRRFRGWLHRFFHRRVRDVLKLGRVHPCEDGMSGGVPPDWPGPGLDDGEPCDPEF